MAFVTVLATVATGCSKGGTVGPDGPSGFAILWHQTLPGTNRLSYWFGRPALDGDLVFIADGADIAALDAATGAVRWSRPVRRAPFPAVEALVVGGGAVFVSETDSIMSLDARTGRTRWTFHPDSQAVVAPALDETTFYTGQRGIPVVYALDRLTGALRWRVTVPNSGPFRAYVKGMTTSGDTLYVTVTRDDAPNGYLASGVLVAMDRRTGSELWRATSALGGFHGYADAPIVAGDVLIVHDVLGRSVVAVDRFAARERWRYTSPLNGPARGGAVVGSLVLSAMADGTAIGLDLATGALLWKREIGSSALSGALCNGQFVVVNGLMQRFTVASGDPSGRLGTGGTFTSWPVANGDRLYVTGQDGAYAVGCR